MWYNMPINAEIIKFVQSFSNPLLDRLFISVTMLGEEYFFIVALSLIYWCVNKEMGYKIGFTYLSSMILNAGIKEVLQVPRPIGDPGIRSLRIETATGWSFPSGHTQGVTTFWASLMINLKKKWIYIVGSTAVILVAFSRVYLGVHRPVDVLGAIVIAIVWVFIIDRIFEYIKSGGSKLILLVLILPMLAFAIILRNEDYNKAIGVTIGFFAGYIIEPRYINYRVNASFLVQVFKMLIGITVALVILVFGKLIIPDTMIGDIIRYMIVGLWITIGATFIFERLFKSKNIFKPVSK